VRILVVLHLVLHFCYQTFGSDVFQNVFVVRLAEWGAIQYSTLFCLEGMILAIRYGRVPGGEKEEEDEKDAQAPEAIAFFKRHALEVSTKGWMVGKRHNGPSSDLQCCLLVVSATLTRLLHSLPPLPSRPQIYPLYLIGVAATASFSLLTTGTGSLRRFLLTASGLDAWTLGSPDLLSRDPTWLVATLLFYLSFFPALLKLALPASRGTLLGVMATAWASTAVVPLTFLGFDLELGAAPHLFTLGTTFPLMHAASFVFGVTLGLYFLKLDREAVAGVSQSFLGTAAAAGLLFFFLSTDMFEGRMLLWCYDGLFLGFMGVILLLAAIGKDTFLGIALRVKFLSEVLGPAALTVYLLQGFFLGVAGSVVEAETSTLVWLAFWAALLTAGFFLHRSYQAVYLQQMLPLILAGEESAATAGRGQPTPPHRPSSPASTASSSSTSSPIAGASAVFQDDLSSIEDHGAEYPIQGWFWHKRFLMAAFRLACYYGSMALTIFFYMTLALRFDWKGFASVYDMPVANAFVNFLKYCALLSLPSLTFSMVGHILFPPVLRKRTPSLEALKKAFKHKVFFRIVTRGKHPNLVRSHVLHASNVLRAALPHSQFCLEVATDAPLDLDTFCPGMATELLLPKNYAPVGGAKFKARALQYAIEASAAEPGDWIVHLDEGTSCSDSPCFLTSLCYIPRSCLFSHIVPTILIGAFHLDFCLYRDAFRC